MSTLKRQYAETRMQTSFFSWCRRAAVDVPELSLVYSVPNEGAQTEERRNLMYRMGAMAGVSDICVDFPSCDRSHGYLRIELKVPNNFPSKVQQEYGRLVEKYGCGRYIICRTAKDAAREILVEHMGLTNAEFTTIWERHSPYSARKAQPVFDFLEIFNDD